MSETLLRTKLYIPPMRSNLVPRLQLIEKFQQGLEPGYKLILVSAPAGYGMSKLNAVVNIIVAMNELMQLRREPLGVIARR